MKISKSNLVSQESLRKNNHTDCKIYFGSSNPDPLDSEYETYSNDIVIPGLEEINSDQRLLGRHFYIRYCNDQNKYYIRDLGNGYGTFFKLKSSYTLHNNCLFNIGDTYIVVSFEDESNQNEITLKVFSGIIKYNPIKLNSNNLRYTIGRNIECDISINDSMLSRVHSTISFTNSSWNLEDGYLNDEDFKHQESTNGTWVYLHKETELISGLTVKANLTVFKVNQTKSQII